MEGYERRLWEKVMREGIFWHFLWNISPTVPVPLLCWQFLPTDLPDRIMVTQSHREAVKIWHERGLCSWRTGINVGIPSSKIFIIFLDNFPLFFSPSLCTFPIEGVLKSKLIVVIKHLGVKPPFHTRLVLTFQTISTFVQPLPCPLPCFLGSRHLCLLVECQSLWDWMS